MSYFNYHMQQLLLDPHSIQVPAIEKIFADLRAVGCDSILLEYNRKFPYRGTLSSAADPAGYSPDEVAQIADAARRNGLELIPKGLSFSHASWISAQSEFAALTDGTALNLALDESARLIEDGMRELIQAHPGVRLVHLGGDEIFGFGSRPESCEAILKHGRSGLYIDFVNRIAAALKPEGVQVAVWGDMLIRYPEALGRLDRSVVVFYWDYWGSGEESAFVTIGGGCPDLFVLDRAGLPRDLEKMLRNPVVREAGELPIAAVERYRRYWRWQPGDKRARSFPYVEFFREMGLEVVSSFLAYPEKGSILGNYAEKLPHVATSIRRNRAYGGGGFLSCLWQPDWPDWRAVFPALAAAMVRGGDDGDALSDAALYQRTASLLGAGWSGESLKRYFEIGNDFEFNDLLDLYWAKAKPSAQLDFVRRSGWMEEELRRVRETRSRAAEFLRNPAPEDPFPRFAVRDVGLRAEAEELLLTGGDPRATAESLRAQYARLRQLERDFYRPGDAAAPSAVRYPPFLDLLADEAEFRC